MSRTASFLSWLAGAVASVVGYWWVAVYLLREFDRGYGQLAWFQLNLYLSAISVVIGLVGYGAATILWPRTESKLASALAGVAFTVLVRVLALALDLAFPYRDMIVQGFAGALLLGALSTFVDRRNAA